MEITNIRVTKARREGPVKAFVSVEFDDVFVVHGIRIVEASSERLFVAMPAKKGTTGKFRDFAHPIDDSFRQKMTGAIFEKYEELKNE